MSVSTAVATYLNYLNGGHVADAVPVLVTLDTSARKPEVYEGAFYQYRSGGAEGSSAARMGRVEWHPRFYLVGEVPKCYQRRRKTCFRFAGETVDWYQGGGYTPYLLRNFGPADFKHTMDGHDLRPYHPFGHWFDLSAWATASGQAIDHYEPKPYTRKVMSVLYL